MQYDDLHYDDPSKPQSIFEKMDLCSMNDSEVIQNDKPYTWGTNGLDYKISPIQRNHLVFLVGESSGGKTAYGFDMAIKNAVLGHRVIYLSLEMTKEGMIRRIARSYAGITIYEERMNNYPKDKKDKYNEMVDRINDISTLKVVGVPRGMRFTIQEVKELVDAYSKNDIMFIDNFGFIQPKDGQTDYDRDVEASRELSRLVNDIQLPLIIMHHFKKGTGTKKRGLDSLLGSAKISHFADTVIHVMRNTEPDVTEQEKSELKLLVLKDREFGETAFPTVYFRGGSFYDMCYESLADEASYIFNQ